MPLECHHIEKTSVILQPIIYQESNALIEFQLCNVCIMLRVMSVHTTITFPRITPTTTASKRLLSTGNAYGAYPPPILSNIWDHMTIPRRINPIAPLPPRKRINVSWETSEQHHKNDKRRTLLQRREHLRYHTAWSKAFYGAPAELEAYR